MHRARQKGFTLLELVIVIVILGILAAIAIPRLISLQREARIVAVDGFYSALRSGANLVYAKAASNGLTDQTNVNIDLDGDGVFDLIANYGYPRAEIADIQALFDDLSPRHRFTGGGVGNTVTMSFDGVPNCGVIYTAPSGPGQRPIITRTVAGC